MTKDGFVKIHSIDVNDMHYEFAEEKAKAPLRAPSPAPSATSSMISDDGKNKLSALFASRSGKKTSEIFECSEQNTQPCYKERRLGITMD